MSDKPSTPFRPQKPVAGGRSAVALVMAAALTMFQAIRGTKPRVKGYDSEGRIRYRVSTGGTKGAKGCNRSLGGTPEANQAVYRVPLKFLHSHRRRIEKARLEESGRNVAFERGPL